MMEKTLEVFLFGAGAVNDWQAPTTSEITEKIRASGFCMKNSDIKITEFIYQRLLKCGYKDSEINFETIINVIEELIVYNSEYNSETQTPSLLKSFLAEIDLSDLYNYSIRGNQRKHCYQLQIPCGVDYKFSNSSVCNENPNQFFLQHLINELLSSISDIVSKYLYNEQGELLTDKDSEINVNFRKWIKKLNINSILRMYTLNYDCLFKSLLDKENIQCFDGFKSYSANGHHYEHDPVKIMSDTTSNVHYNLHGSAYWEVKQESLPHPVIAKTKGIAPQINDEPNTSQMEKGKSIQITNIITGYQKTQKSAITPFRQFQSAFDKDCCLTKRILIVGYSFNDEHINESLKTALRYNKDLFIEIIDPSFIKNGMNTQLALKIFPYVASKNTNQNQVADNKYSYFDGKIKVHTIKFAEYLKKNQ